MAPRLTVVVPTRERHDTLLWALKTCVTQDCDDLEILVSDNASTDATREVVSSYDDPRVRYVNPGRRLGMSEHWEFALSHVESGHVTFLGDDDGLMPSGAAEMLRLLAEHEVEALTWPLASYYWPGFLDRTLANTISMPLPQPRRVGVLDSRATLAEVAAFDLPHYFLPSPYWGVVSHAALDRARGRNGRVFNSINPDLYSGVAVAAVTDRLARSHRILTLSGASAHSNGASHVTGASDGASSAQATFAAESGLPFHPDLTFCSSVPLLVAESLLQARDHVDPSVPVAGLPEIARAALRHPDYLLHPGVRREIQHALADSAARADDSDVAALVETEQRHVRRRAVLAGADLVLRGNPLVDGAPHAVDNIFDACRLADSVLGEADSTAKARRIVLRGRALKVRRAAGRARGLLR